MVSGSGFLAICRFVLVAFAATIVSACTGSGVGDGLDPSSRPVPQESIASADPAAPQATAATQPVETGNQPLPSSDTSQPTNQQALQPTAPQNPSATAANNAGNGQVVASLPEPANQPLTQVKFLPVTGAPQGVVTSLAKMIRSEADSRQIRLLAANQDGAQYEIKGYFSALDDGSGTLVVYVWDILDLSGRRIHRISGNERSSSSKTDPWSAIGEEELKRVSSATMSKFETWLRSRQG